MYIIVDIILVSIIVLFTIIGYKKGFINQVLDLASGVIAFFAAYFITPLVAPVVSKHLFYDNIAGHISSAINGMREGEGVSGLFGDGKANEAFREFISRFGADYETVKQNFAANAEQSADETVSGITEHVASPVSYALSYALCFIVIFIAVLILLWVLKHVLDLAAKLPVLKHANKILGLVVGFLFGILVVWVVALVIKLGLPYLNAKAPSVFPEDLVDRSYVLRFSYYINALRPMVGFFT